MYIFYTLKASHIIMDANQLSNQILESINNSNLLEINVNSYYSIHDIHDILYNYLHPQMLRQFGERPLHDEYEFELYIQRYKDLVVEITANLEQGNLHNALQNATYAIAVLRMLLNYQGINLMIR